MSVDITLLGGFSVRIDGRPVPHGAWRRRSASAVVKILALSEARALHREQVLDLLWPDLAPASSLPKLHQAAHYARAALGRRDGVLLRGDRVSLLPDVAVRIDLLELHRRGERALSCGDGPAAGRLLRAYAGELLPEDLYADWSAPHREALEALRSRLRRLAGVDDSENHEENHDENHDENTGIGSDRPEVAALSRRVRPAVAPSARHGARRSRTLLLVIDDLAAADPASLQLLHRVARSITTRGIGRVVELG